MNSNINEHLTISLSMKINETTVLDQHTEMDYLGG
jgi:hypothetical protein